MRLIATDYHLQIMRCRVCAETFEIPRRLLRDPESLLMRLDDMTQDHRECAAHPDNPALAATHRGFRKRLERELARAAAAAQPKATRQQRSSCASGRQRVCDGRASRSAR